jgi:hypothetical protein
VGEGKEEKYNKGKQLERLTRKWTMKKENG